MVSTNSTTPPPPHLLGVLRTLWLWRKPILATTAAGTLLALVISLVLPVYYQSQTRFLATSPRSNSVEAIFGTTNEQIDIYGNGDDIERLLAIAESDQLVDHMVRTFELYEVYDIDTTNTKAPLYVQREFLDNYEVGKSPRDVIELSVLDKDPERAAAMAREARKTVNRISVGIMRGGQTRTVESLRQEIAGRESALNDLNNELRDLRSTSGIYSTEAQGEALATLSSSLDGSLVTTEARLNGYRRRGGRGARDSIAKLEIQLAALKQSRTVLDSQLVQLNTSVGPINNLEEDRERVNTAVSNDRLRLKQFESLLNADQRALEVVEEARVPVVKAKPIRSLIVLLGAAFSFLLAVGSALLIDSGRKYDWSAIFSK